MAEVEEPSVQTPAEQPQVSQPPARSFDPAVNEAAEAEKEKEARGPSFSEISELPPLKEIYTPPPPPPEPSAETEPVQQEWSSKAQPEKPKVQPREVARKAVSEIKKTPPKLFVYSIAVALGVILLVVAMIAWRIHSENSADEGSTEQPVASAPASPAAKPAWNTAAQPPTPTPAPTPERINAPKEAPVVSVVPKYSRKKTKVAPASAPSIIPGQLTVNSTPEGAEVHIDGRTDPSWVTPFNLPGIQPGQHSVTITRAGYSTESRDHRCCVRQQIFSSGPTRTGYGHGGCKQRARGRATFHRWQGYRASNSGPDSL